MALDVGGIGNETVERDQRPEGGKDRDERVESDPGREMRDVVLAHLVPRPLQHLPPAGFWNLLGLVRVIPVPVLHSAAPLSPRGGYSVDRHPRRERHAPPWVRTLLPPRLDRHQCRSSSLA